MLGGLRKDNSLKSVAGSRQHWEASLFNHPHRLTAAWVPSLAENFIFLSYTLQLKVIALGFM